MTCPICGEKTKVVDSREPDCETVYRRRKCVKCDYRFSTIEVEVELKEKESQRPIIAPEW